MTDLPKYLDPDEDPGLLAFGLRVVCAAVRVTGRPQVLSVRSEGHVFRIMVLESPDMNPRPPEHELTDN